MTTKEWGDEISWKFGSCASNNQSPTRYESDKKYEFECCQPAGTYELDCMDSHGDGWHGSYIEIGNNPTKYCKNFQFGGSQKQQVEHTI